MRLEVRQIHVDQIAAAPARLISTIGRRSRSMRSLPANQRAVLAFVVLDDLPVAEVARLIGKSPAATQSLLQRARDGFRRAYQWDRDDD